jgi:MoaA/NifB/PqqE/SkfB family radical SAM enzyme
MNRDSSWVTKSGLVAFTDQALGLAVYSPYTGLLYGVHSEVAAAVLAWLDGTTTHPGCDNSYRTLGNGWAVKSDKAVYPIPQLLPTAAAWRNVPIVRRPLLINWLITGRCPLACSYCYAEDLMRDDAREPTAARIASIGQTILKKEPAVVVITGGDPLFSPRLADAIEMLSGKAGILVDTSGYTLTPDHIAMFKQHRVSVRISIDSTIPRIHGALRSPSSLYPGFVKRGGSLELALSAMEQLINSDIPTSVQTVATKKNANDLVPLGDVLFRLGVRSWRIFKVAPSQVRFEQWKRLVGTHTDTGQKYTGQGGGGPYAHAFTRVMRATTSNWNNQMSVQVTRSDAPNSVVLVAPDGKFVTESNTGNGKILIDPRQPFTPSVRSISNTINLAAHVGRYLNLTSSEFVKTL